MFILKIMGKIMLIPVWIIVAVMTGIISVAVNIISLAKGISGIILSLLLIGTVICYHDIVQSAFLIMLIVAGYLLLFAGVAIEVAMESVRSKIGNMIIA